MDCNNKSKLTSKVIASHIQPINGWSEITPSRPGITSYKIARDSGYATIAVNKEVELLMDKYSFRNYEFANEILNDFSKEQIEKTFMEVANKDKRVSATIDSIYTGTLGSIPALIVVHDFYLEENGINGRVKYYYIIGDTGWIAIGCAFKKEEEHLYIHEIESILRSSK